MGAETVKSARTIVLLALAAVAMAGCGDPSAPRRAPEAGELNLFAVLSPEWTLSGRSYGTSQHVFVSPLSSDGVVTRPSVTVHEDGELLLDTGPIEWVEDESHPCIARYGTIRATGSQIRCLELAFEPRYGARYRIRVAAEGRPTVTATTRVPGDFRILEADAAGDPPGSDRLQVRWTRSSGAYRYLVALRPESMGRSCGEDCRRPGFRVTTDTVMNTVYSAEELDGASGPWTVEIYAVDQALYAFLTTGLDDDLFPVPPTQNVDGGYGAVGAWVLRSTPIGEAAE